MVRLFRSPLSAFCLTWIVDTFGVPTTFKGDVLGRDYFLALSAFQGAAVTPSGLAYSLVVLPSLPAASPEIMQKALQLASANVPLVLPASQPTLAIGAAKNDSADAIVTSIAAQLWAFNSSKVFVGASVNKGLSNLHIFPDFEYNATTNAGLAFIRAPSLVPVMQAHYNSCKPCRSATRRRG